MRSRYFLLIAVIGVFVGNLGHGAWETVRQAREQVDTGRRPEV